MREPAVASSPELAILLVTDSYEAIAECLRCLRTGGDPALLEVVVATVRGARIAPERLQADGFARVRVIDGGDGEIGIAEARAVRAATAPWVVFAQGHIHPQPGFVAALLAARAPGVAVIGPAMACANPEHASSRAELWLGYGRWMDAPPRGVHSDVPAHGSAYDRAALLALGPELDRSLEASWRLQQQLRLRGGICWLEPAARAARVNASSVRAYVDVYYRLGRRFAAERSLDWARTRRLAFAAGSPALPALRVARIVADALRRQPAHAEWTLLPLVTLGAIASAAGELVGYLLGFGAPSVFVRRNEAQTRRPATREGSRPSCS